MAVKKGSKSGSSRSGSSRTTAKSKSKPSAGSGLWQGLFSAILMTFFGRAILALAGAGVLIGINLLFSGDRYDVFYILCAIEIIAFVAVGWLKLLLRPDSE